MEGVGCRLGLYVWRMKGVGRVAFRVCGGLQLWWCVNAKDEECGVWRFLQGVGGAVVVVGGDGS